MPNNINTKYLGFRFTILVSDGFKNCDIDDYELKEIINKFLLESPNVHRVKCISIHKEY